MGRFGWFVVALVVLGAGILIAINWMQSERDQKPVANRIAENIQRQKEASQPKPDPIPENYVEVGGIMRPREDVEALKANGETGAAKRLVIPSPGKVPGVALETNPSTQTLAQAFDNPDLGHRLTSMLPAPEFDREQYTKDPETYLNTIEPGRIWQSLEYAETVVPLKRTSDYFREVLQGEKVNLEAKAEPGMPVTFYSPRLGQFDNQLSVITVRADDDGLARASFLASPGTRGEIDILASSPVHSGQARYLVNVLIPARASTGPTTIRQ